MPYDFANLIPVATFANSSITVGDIVGRYKYEMSKVRSVRKAINVISKQVSEISASKGLRCVSISTIKKRINQILKEYIYLNNQVNQGLKSFLSPATLNTRKSCFMTQISSEFDVSYRNALQPNRNQSEEKIAEHQPVDDKERIELEAIEVLEENMPGEMQIDPYEGEQQVENMQKVMRNEQCAGTEGRIESVQEEVADVETEMAEDQQPAQASHQ